MTAPTLVHVHGGTRDGRRQIARVLLDHSVTALLSSNAAEAAKCLADSRVHISVILNDAQFAETVRTMQRTVQCVQFEQNETAAQIARAVLHLLRQGVPTCST